ncbi:unnamed protein product [Cercospora beticola]|nr:unnamed protein product [Cercospora beticola]
MRLITLLLAVVPFTFAACNGGSHGACLAGCEDRYFEPKGINDCSLRECNTCA